MVVAAGAGSLINYTPTPAPPQQPTWFTEQKWLQGEFAKISQSILLLNQQVQSSGAGAVGANPTATASNTAVNGSALTFMRSDAAPAVQLGSSSQFGLVKVDGTTITAVGGVISGSSGGAVGGNPTAIAGPTAINGTAATFLRSDGAPAIQLGTAAQKGLVQVDGTTITATAGVITAALPVGANPSAVAGPTAINGSALTFMRSDAAPAIQLGTASQKGIVQVDGSSILASSGVISVGSPGTYIDAVYKFGFVGDDSTDNNAAMNSLVSYANTAGNGTVFFFRPGKYRFSGTYTFTANDIVLMGAGSSDRGAGTWFRHTATSGDLLTFNGTDQSGVQDILFEPVNYKTSGAEVKVTGEANLTTIRGCRFKYCYRPIDCTSFNYCYVEKCYILNVYANAGVYAFGTSASPSNGLFLTDVVTNNPYPTGTPPTPANAFASWTASHAYTIGQTVIDLTNGFVWQCTTAGTSNASSFPAHPSYSLSSDPFTKMVTDGSVVWSFVCNDSLSWLWFDSYVNSVTLRHCAFLGGYNSVRMTDTTNSTGSSVAFLFAFDLECDFSYGHALELIYGSGVHITGSYLSTSITGSGLQIENTFTGEVTLNGSRCHNNAENGASVGAGPTSVSIISNTLNNNLGSGIVTQAASDNFAITGNAALSNTVSNYQNSAGLSSTRVFEGNVGQGILYPVWGVARAYRADSDAVLTTTFGCKWGLFGVPAIDSSVTWLNSFLPGVDVQGSVTCYAISPNGVYGSVSAARSSDNTLTAPQNVIGGMCQVVQDNTTQAQLTWAGYDAGYITSTAAVSHMIGREISVFNAGTAVAEDPYNVNPSGSAVGLRIDSSKTTSPALGGNTISAMMDLINNGAKAYAGIVIGSNSLDTTGVLGGNPAALLMPKDYSVSWFTAAATLGGGIFFDSGSGALTAVGGWQVQSGGLGYGPGSKGQGGSVTQATSLTTAVTLNKICGQITTVSGAFTAGTEVSFTVNDSLVAGTDTVIVNMNTNSGLAWASNVSSGSFVINIYPLTTATTSVILNFAVIKAVTS